MRVYLSSTYIDLSEYRRQVAAALRELGHDVIGMEEYVSEGSRPADRCRREVAGSSVCVLIVGWRYGFVVQGEADSPAQSVTHMEYQAAVEQNVPVLAFLADPEGPWLLTRTDAFTGENESGARIQAFRSQLANEQLVSFFSSPADLARSVAASVTLSDRRGLADLVMEHTVVSQDQSRGYRTGDSDSTLPEIENIVRAVRDSGAEILTVRLGSGGEWWSTRLYLLARLVADMTLVERILFTGPNDEPVGLAGPQAVCTRMLAAHPVLAEYELSVAQTPWQRDDASARVMSFVAFFNTRDERTAKHWVRTRNLREWLGCELVAGSVDIEGNQGTTLSDVQQILGWQSEYVIVKDVPSRLAPRVGMPWCR
jgi:Domain of unknown function (DUF4062)